MFAKGNPDDKGPRAKPGADDRSGGGGKNDQKRPATDTIDEKIADAKDRLREAKSRPNKTSEDNANIDKIKNEIKHLESKRRKSENHSMKPKG